MSAHLSRCFMGSAEEIAAHRQLVEDAKAMGAAAERRRIVEWLLDAGFKYNSNAVERVAERIEDGEHWGKP